MEKGTYQISFKNNMSAQHESEPTPPTQCRSTKRINLHESLFSSSLEEEEKVDSVIPPVPVEMAYLLLNDCYGSFRIIPSLLSNYQQQQQQQQSKSKVKVKTPMQPSFHQWLPVRVIPKRQTQQSLMMENVKIKPTDIAQQEHPNDESYHSNTTTNSTTTTAVPTLDDDHTTTTSSSCQRCHLILQQQQQQESHNNNDTATNTTAEYILDLNHIVPFDGTIRDVIHRNDDNGGGACTCNCCGGEAEGRQQQQQRSDAALMIGLLVACVPQVQIVQCSILLCPNKSQQKPKLNPNDDDNDQFENDSDDYYGSILVTLSFPNLSSIMTTSKSNNNSTHNHHRERHRRSINASTTLQQNKRYSASSSSSVNKVKPLYPALQLLLTLIRSDWDQYEYRKQQVQQISRRGSTTTTTTQPRSFFPSSLTLGNIYDRIQQQGSTTAPNLPPLSPSSIENGDIASSSCTATEPSNGTTVCWLLSIPFEILQRHIVTPYCNAISLASLRSTCHYMHYSLRTIVPGLRLRLYQHQINSLYWMRQREASIIKIESDCFGINNSNSNNQHYCTTSATTETGDIHRSITGGASVKLTMNPLSSSWPLSSSSSIATIGTTTIYLDPYTGLEILLSDDIRKLHDLPRKVACGGLLCDDPGLGKTITVLSLILQTASSPIAAVQKNTNMKGKESVTTTTNDDETLFEMYWMEEILPAFRRPYLLKLVNDFNKNIPVGIVHFPLSNFRKSIDNNNYETNFNVFDDEIRNAIDNCQTEEYPETASPMMTIWNGMVQDFKRLQLHSIRNKFANIQAKPNSRVAALVEEEARKKHLESLIPSLGTLIVVPSVLLEHWKVQINQHVDFRYLTDRIPLVFEYQRTDTGVMTFGKATILCRINNTHAPMVFIDNGGTRPLPPAEFLSMFQIVVTTTQRFINEAKKGSFQEELEKHHLDDEYGACELLKVHWSRMVVDEGHSMGNDGHNSSITFASWVTAHRRWAMTGTPTKQNATQLSQMRGLMRFLQHDFFTTRLNGDVLWKVRITKGWKDGDLASFFRLHNLLLFFMRRHTKSNIIELPSPLFCKTNVETSYVEANTYNTLVSAVQMNLLLTSMNGKTSGFQDSLLHRSQAKNARLALQNIRRVCTGWSRVVPTIAFRFYAETLEMAKSFNHSEDAIVDIKLFMTRASQEELSSCSCCGIQISTMLLMSCCGGQICTECMDSSTSTCYLCDSPFDVDELQKFQPGFVLDWRSNLELSKSTDKVLDPNESFEQAPGILIRPHLERRRTKKFGDGHACEYDPYTTDGRCIYCFEEHNVCCLLGDSSRCKVCYRNAEEVPMDESKSHFLSRRLLELHEKHRKRWSHPYDSAFSLTTTRSLKVIVFSQFRAALNFVGDRLLRKFGTACVAEFFGSHRKQELHKFKYEQSCFCLLLTKDGSEGLDLSFVTNVIFLEEIFDKSLEDQVVARAWRMGANGRVIIETLIAKNTIEEAIGEQMQSRCSDGENKGSSRTGDQQRLKSLLQSLRFITTHQSRFHNTASRTEEGIEASAEEMNTLKRSLSDANSDEIVLQRSKRECRTVRFADIN